MIFTITVLFSGLVAGLMFSYSCSVNLGLHHLTDIEYIKTMQTINIEIQNIYFFIVFIGLLLLLPTSTWLSYSVNNKATFYLMLTATLFYFVGVFGVTILGNVPLNNQLAKINLANTSEETLSTFRNHFESNWTKYHLIRTLASIVSFLLTILAFQKTTHSI